jgi:hypothetical protein
MRMVAGLMEFVELGGFGALMVWLVMVSALSSSCTNLAPVRQDSRPPVTQVLGCGDGDGGGPADGGDGDVMIALTGCGGANPDASDVGLVGDVGSVDLNDPETRAEIEKFWADQKVRSAMRDLYRGLTDEQFAKFFGELLEGLSDVEQDDFLHFLKTAQQMRAPGGSIMDPADIEAAGLPTSALSTWCSITSASCRRASSASAASSRRDPVPSRTSSTTLGTAPSPPRASSSPEPASSDSCASCRTAGASILRPIAPRPASSPSTTK